MDTTREALISDLFVMIRDGYMTHARRQLEALIDYEVAAGVAEVERRTAATLDEADFLLRWYLDHLQAWRDGGAHEYPTVRARVEEWFAKRASGDGVAS